ncbi:MAG TPA: ABC transporter substrate-binding protein [Casimicrobiaceae bacterium]|nr:ABC transporter substrate-binding protein [Casimicrobiaceae bacterium]
MTPDGRRRMLLFLGLFPAVAVGQPTASPKVARVGYLFHGSSDSGQWIFAAVQQRLRELGWVEGRNVVSEYRYADRKPERLEGLAGDLVRRRVDVIVALQTVSAHAARKATRDIPVVFATSDSQGLVDNLARPEGNLTGVSNIGAAIAGKQLQVMREVVPGSLRAVALVNPENPSTRGFVKDAETAAQLLGLRLAIVAKRELGEIDRLLRAMAQTPDFLVVQNDALFHSEMKGIVSLAAAHRLPAIFGAREFPLAGGLLSYGANLQATYGELGNYIDKILRGAKPGDLPVTQPTKFELVVNSRTARTLMLALPPSLTLRADEIIE